MSTDRLIAEAGKKIQEGAIGRLATLQIFISARSKNVRDVLVEALEIVFYLTEKKITRLRFQGDDFFLQGTIRFEDGSVALLDVDILGKPRIFIEVQGSKGLIVLPGAPSFFTKAKAGVRIFSPEIKRISALVQKSASSSFVINLK